MRSLLATLIVASAAISQEAVYPSRVVAVQYDSGFLANPQTSHRIVWSQDVTVAGDWLQLQLGDAHLPQGSQLKIYAPSRPDWAQWHDARSLSDYRMFSCQFAGPTLRVELHAGAGTTANRVRIDAVHVQDVGSTVETDSICGTTDDRVLGSDVRQCRLNAGCTAWLFSPFAVGTAGHCMSAGTAGKILHFNVPLSSATGGATPAHPNDQYAIESFLQFLNAGVGQDWATLGAVRNSNTGLYPGQAQGSWYTVVGAPALATGQQIRITGYGSGNGVSGSPTWNLVQKTHLGNRVSTATANALRYDTDTTGGNSGSPVILENTGEVIGVHTHGGCSATGGGNSGTDASRADFLAGRNAALALHTIGSISAMGTGCGGSVVPVFSVTGTPEITRTLTVRASGLAPAVTLGWFVIGLSASSWNGAPLPADLGAIGIEGCQLYTSIDYSEGVVSAGGVVSRAYAMPNDSGLVGQHLYFQCFAASSSASTSLGVVGSNAVDVLLGN